MLAITSDVSCWQRGHDRTPRERDDGDGRDTVRRLGDRPAPENPHHARRDGSTRHDRRRYDVLVQARACTLPTEEMHVRTSRRRFIVWSCHGGTNQRWTRA